MEYTGRNTAQISFPLGGIGTGCIGLGGNGGLRDIEIKNRPDKNTTAEFTHFAIKAEDENGVIDTRIVQGDLERDHMGCMERPLYAGYGFGPDRGTMAGFPHFEKMCFRGEYPIATLHFEHRRFPGEVEMMAFNPLIPTNEDDSSIPAAFFRFRIRNTSHKKLAYTLALSCCNFYHRIQAIHTYEECEKVKMLWLSGRKPRDSVEYGDLAIVTDCEEVSHQAYWFRGSWFDNSSVFWQEYSRPGKLPAREYGADEKDCGQNANTDVATLAAHVEIAPNESREIRFVLSWSNPYINNHWEITHGGLAEEDIQKRRSHKWMNYYATLFEDSRASAVYAIKHFDRLYRETKLYQEAIFHSDLPEMVKEAVTANVSVLKSPTCLRLSDGSFYAFEGVHAHMGSCEGVCTHVWSYAYALAFLFPRLERSARTNEYRYSMQNNGGMGFRLQLPLGVGPTNHRPAADGQFGTVLRVYREFMICGDVKWLEGIWPEVKRSIAFAWSDQNADRWDPEQTGILTGRQHHTLDMELFGPNAWLSGMYLAALKAASRLAQVLGEEDVAGEYLAVFERGKSVLNDKLYNGEYFFQNIDLKDQGILESFGGEAPGEKEALLSTYWNEEYHEMKYQIGEGCSIDQVLGQWHGDLLQLGEIFQRDKVSSALRAIWNYNFIPDMREHVNPCRVYGMNGEQGTMICAYPPGRKKPLIPIPYCEETMHGFEYQVASHMLRHHMEEEGLACVKAVRDRYDGYKRNPWNEMECGSNYSRSLSSYALLLAYSGFVYDMYRKRVGFHPIHPEEWNFFWSLDSGFGTAEKKNGCITWHLLYGTLEIRELEIELDGVKGVCWKGKYIRFVIRDQAVCLEEPVKLVRGECVIVIYE